MYLGTDLPWFWELEVQVEKGCPSFEALALRPNSTMELNCEKLSASKTSEYLGWAFNVMFSQGKSHLSQNISF